VRRLAVVILLAITAVGSGSNAWSAQPAVDVTKPMTSNLEMCKNTTELDCIESFSLLDPKTIPLNYRGFRELPQRTDPNGNTRYEGHEVFELDGQEVALWAELQSPKMVIGTRPDGTQHVGSSLRTYVSAPELFDHRFEVRIRTSWLKPQDIQLHAVEAEYEIQKIPGGTRWIFSGKQQSISYYNDNWNEKMATEAKADFTSHRLHFLVHHLGKGGSYFDETCGEKGFTVESHNAPGAGMPFWDESTKSLNFSIQSPHADSSGKPVVGYFRLWMPESYLDCKWPKNSLSAAATLQVFVQNEDGSYQTATTVVGRFKDMIRIEAYGFHYSAPTIKVVAAKKPVTKVLAAFTKGSTLLSKAQKTQIADLIKKVKPKSLVCTATYLQSSARATATTQATAVCLNAKSIVPSLGTTVNVVQTSKQSEVNKVTLSASR
jgi:hypothetical protein